MKQRKQVIAEKRAAASWDNLAPRKIPPMVTRVEARMWNWQQSIWGHYQPAILLHPARHVALDCRS